jgi:hypothetical protein
MECCITAEAVDRSIRVQENLLHQIFSVMMVTAESQSQDIHYAPVPRHQQTEGIDVSIFGSDDKIAFRGTSHPVLTAVDTLN